MDLGAYEILKNRGETLVTKAGPTAITAIVSMPKFDASTGEQNGNVIAQFNVQGIDEQIAALKAAKVASDADFDARLASLQLIRVDVEAAIKA